MVVFTVDNMKPFFDALEKLDGLDQREDRHPEKDALEHSLQAFYHACRETDDIELILAALLHDVGKAIEMFDHPQLGADFLHDYVSPKVEFLVRNHLRINYYLSGEMHKLFKVKELSEHPFFRELVMLKRFDHLGRNPHKKTLYNKQVIVDKLNSVVERRFKNNTERSENDELS